MAWRLRGLKVRSRNRIAPLAGRSRHAYALWIERHEPILRRAIPVPRDAIPILPVIDCRNGEEGLDRSLESLARNATLAPPVLLGRTGRSLRHVERPRELAGLIDDAGQWLCAMRAGDQLASGALAAYSAPIGTAGPSRILYADDDLCRPGEGRTKPHFKPDWNPDLYRHHDFVSGSSIVFATPEMLAGLPDDEWMAAVIELALPAGRPIHLPLILHHRLERPTARLPGDAPHHSGDAPLVDVIVPTRNKVELLRACLEGIERTAYRSIATTVVDNGSDDPATLAYLAEIERRGVSVLRLPGPFNYSMLNNAAVRQSHGAMLCFLNNDVEILDGNWLDIMVQQARRPEIGAVGARLLYPDRTIQHAGVFLGIGGGAGHGHRFLHVDDPGYFDRAKLPQQVSAVTAACMVVDRSKFQAVGGFDETDFPIAFNDVDLCLKLNQRGWQSFYEPRATLIHHESKSRGLDSSRANRTRFAGELAALKRKWRTDERRDPYHHPQLSPYSEQFVVAL